jgi:tetratricopeptide (TPR) repeat protein
MLQQSLVIITRLLQAQLVIVLLCQFSAAQKSVKTEGTGIYTKVLTVQELLDSYKTLSKKQAKPVPVIEKDKKNFQLAEIERLTGILNSDPQFAEGFFERGLNYSELGEYDKAIADYSKAIALNPYDADSFNNRGVACARTGNYERAIADFIRATYLNSGQKLGLLGSRAEEEKNFPPADAKKEHANGYNLGLVLLNKKAFTPALATWNTYIKKEPKDINGYRLRAETYRKLGKIAEAKADENRIKILTGKN